MTRTHPTAPALMVAIVLAAAIALLGTTPAGAIGGLRVTNHPQGLAFAPPGAHSAQDQAAADPDVVRFGNTYFAYTTGSTWGNHIGVLRSSSPNHGFHTITGKPYGSSAFPSIGYQYPIRPWQVAGTTNAPGVFKIQGRYVMYYTVQAAAGHGGHYCLARATASQPSGPFHDVSNGPWLCMDAQGGAIDPSPFIDRAGRPWLYFKTYDLVEHGAQPARLWVVRLTKNGLSHPAAPVPLLSQAAVSRPYETIENPQMVSAGDAYVLIYSRGRWNSSDYRQGYATCAGPTTGCDETNPAFLRSYPNVRGPGGGTMFTDTHGRFFIAFHAWHGSAGCTSDGVHCARKLFVAGVRFS